MTTKSALSSSKIFSANSGVLIRPHGIVNIPVSLRMRAASSTLNPFSISTGATSYSVAAVKIFPRLIFNTSTPNSLASLQNSITSSTVNPPSNMSS